MTKTTKPQKIRPSSASNPRSRAAKRATSPSINTDKSLKEAPRVSEITPTLGASRGNGVSKKQKKKQMTRGQRARLEKGFARAEIVNDQLEKKLDESKSRVRKRDQRKEQWDNVNGSVKEETRKMGKVPEREREVNEGAWEDVEEVEEGDEGDVDMKVADATGPDTTEVEAKQATNGHAQDELDLIT